MGGHFELAGQDGVVYLHVPMHGRCSSIAELTEVPGLHAEADVLLDGLQGDTAQRGRIGGAIHLAGEQGAALASRGNFEHDDDHASACYGLEVAELEVLADTAVEAHALNGILQVIEIDGSAAPTLRDRLSRSGFP